MTKTRRMRRRRPSATLFPLATAALMASLRSFKADAFPLLRCAPRRSRVPAPSVVLLRAAEIARETDDPAGVYLGAEDDEHPSERFPAATLRAAEIGRETENPAGVFLGAEDDDPPEERTLYDVLRCPPTASRDELKTSYVALARLSHPDAAAQSLPAVSGVGSEDDDEEEEDPPPDFNEIARAWKILGDRRERRRYDRRLGAAKLSADVERTAADAFEAAVGTAGAARFVAEAAARAAGPLRRRIEAGSRAAAEAAGRELSPELREERDRRYASARGGEADGSGGPGLSAGEHFGSALKSAVEASRRAAEAVDALELLEKAEGLERRAKGDAALSRAIGDELAGMLQYRTLLTLSTSTADLSSMDAYAILDGLNTLDEVTPLEKLFKVRKTLAEEIADLEEAERAYYEATAAHTAAERGLEERRGALSDAEESASHAAEAERRAGLAVERARELVSSNAETVGRREGRTGATEKAVKSAEAGLSRAEKNLGRKRERVRMGLSKKEGEIGSSVAPAPAAADGVAAGSAVLLDSSTDSNTSTAKSSGNNRGDADADPSSRIEELSRRERFLAAELAGIEDKAARLRSRAAKLAARADIMESEEEGREEGLGRVDDDEGGDTPDV